MLFLNIVLFMHVSDLIQSTLEMDILNLEIF